MPSLKDKTVLIIGRGSGIARAIALAVSETAAGLSSPGGTRTIWPPRIAAWTWALSRSTSRTSPQ